MHRNARQDIVAPHQAAAGGGRGVSRGLALAGLVVANVLLAIGPWLVRVADVGPVASGFWRLAIAAPLILMLARWRGCPLPRGRTLWLLVLGGLFFAADLAAWHAGLLRAFLANAALLGNAASFLFPIYGFAVARRWPARVQGVALALAAGGVALLLGRSLDLSATRLAGDLLCLLAGIFYLGYLVAIDRTRAGTTPLAALAAVTSAGLLPLLAFALSLGEPVVPHVWWPLVLLSIGSQVAGQGLLIVAVGALDPLVVGLALLLQPVIAAAIGWTAYGERLGIADLAGAAMIAAALLLVRRPVRPRA